MVHVPKEYSKTKAQYFITYNHSSQLLSSVDRLRHGMFARLAQIHPKIPMQQERVSEICIASRRESVLIA